jgi:hypothetical protein
MHAALHLLAFDHAYPAAGTPASAVYSDAADTVSTPMGQTATGNALANANLPTGVTAQVTSFSIAGSTQVYPAGSNVTLADPITGQPIGTLTVAADGTYTFDPVDGYIGPTPAINVYSKASNGQTAVSSLTLDVLQSKHMRLAPAGGRMQLHFACFLPAAWHSAGSCIEPRTPPSE